MAVVQVSLLLYTGLPSDAKPAAVTGARFYETDADGAFINKVYWYNGSTWLLVASPEAGGAGVGYSASVDVTRPADTNAYTAGDVIGAAAAAIEFPSMGVAGRDTIITGVELTRNVTAIISGETTYKLQLYSVTPPSALADNAAWDLPSGDRASYLGEIDLGAIVDKGSSLRAEVANVNKQVRLARTSLFGYLVTVGAYTPASASSFNIKLHGIGL